MKNIAFFVCLFCISSALYCQQRRQIVHFKILDRNGRPLDGADICVNDSPKYKSDKYGNAYWKWDENSIRTFFSVKRPGYQTLSGIHVNPLFEQDTLVKTVTLLKLRQ
jgi:hypothetical protein